MWLDFLKEKSSFKIRGDHSNKVEYQTQDFGHAVFIFELLKFLLGLQTYFLQLSFRPFDH